MRECRTRPPGTPSASSTRKAGRPSSCSTGSPSGASAAGAELAEEPTARDFVAEAFAHLKFIGFTDAARPLLKKAGVLDDPDEGIMPLKSADDAQTFVAACRKLRFWAREARIKQV